MTDAASSDALTSRAALIDLGPRTQIELGGADRAAFLHNMCTNEIRKLPVGQGCEAFLTDARGHVLAFGYVFAGPDSLTLETVGGEGAKIVTHLDRYLIREKVELHDRSEAWGELLVAGPAADSVLRKVVAGELPVEVLAHRELAWGDMPVSVRRVEFTQPGGWLLSVERSKLAELAAALQSAGAESLDPALWQAARIEARTPLYGLDISDANLPQEVARDATAISFTKGCYIGQETVARIDALGHVNKTLVGLRCETTTVPPRDTPITRDGQNIGQITSAAFSPRLECVVALAYVRRGSNAPGTTLDVAGSKATVV